MFHLKPGVHFEEVKALARGVCAADDQLDRARAVIAHRAAECDALLAHRLAHFGRDEGRGRFLHHLLMAALDAAFALIKIENVAVLIAEDLDFDVARIEDELLDEHAVIAKRIEPLALGCLKTFAHVLLIVCQPHALAAAARAGFHHHRIADLGRNAHRVLGIIDLTDKAGDDIDARFQRELLALDLVTHRGNRVYRRADKRDAFRRQCLGKAGAFGEKAIARMNRIRACRLARSDNLVGQQIALRSGRGANMHRLIRHPHKRRARIGIGINRHCGNTHPARGLNHPASNFAAIGDEDFLEHSGNSDTSHRA